MKESAAVILERELAKIQRIKIGNVEKTARLARAVKDLWIIHDDLCSVWLLIEDEEGMPRYSRMAREFDDAIQDIDSLICRVEQADRFMKKQRQKVAK